MGSLGFAYGLVDKASRLDKEADGVKQSRQKEDKKRSTLILGRWGFQCKLLVRGDCKASRCRYHLSTQVDVDVTSICWDLSMETVTELCCVVGSLRVPEVRCVAMNSLGHCWHHADPVLSAMFGTPPTPAGTVLGAVGLGTHFPSDQPVDKPY